MVTYAGAPDRPTTLPEILRARAELSPDDRFLTFDGATRTYAEMHAAAGRAAAALASLGVRRGTKVAALLPNSTEILDVWLGSALLGAVFVPINTGLRGEGLRYIVEHSEAEFIAVDEPLTETLSAAVPPGRGPRHRYIRGRDEPPRGYGSLAALLNGAHAAVRPCDVEPGDLASILYTSGTTGLPKGVMNCHNSFAVAANEFTRRYVRIRDDDILYTSLPLFHANAQSLTTVGALISGRPMVLAPRFSASGFLNDVRAHQATVFNYIGAMLTILANRPERPEDARNPLRLAIGGAAPEHLWRRFERRFGLTILEIYGLTESATFCLANPPDDIRPGTIGKTTSWSEVKIIGPDGRTRPDGEPGEIAIRSTRPDTMFLGYHKNGEATREAVGDGWFRTGDRGRREADGYFVFLDRLKDSIRRRGENISSFEIERTVDAHPLVSESAVVGVPSELGEEDVLVAVVPRDGFDCADLVEFCRQRMADFMVPRYVRVVARLPKTATQRVEKYILRENGVQGAWDRQQEVG
ncbi:Long-chain-fatty-acid--CoA ligase [Actinomadura sp. RB99]|uniref:AMP-binding protein n=1 Tax=Actinomadura sp. RB99 TaxID=2691577 RepID=UPI00168A2DBD|nr:AMP-binding protein [Actinomadura sp. RB99]MBD2892301.1 Long-chain-fatty-acid--CoA ligase [Actinomadura sp. RB99]